MKNQNVIYFFFLIIFTGLAFSCNITKDQVEEQQERQSVITNTKPNSKASQQVHPEVFKTMSAEEQWRSFSPKRRNYLRQNPDVYPRYSAFVNAEPNMEEVPANSNPSSKSSVTPYYPTASSKKKTPEEWWNSFSEKRKTYMRQHPEEYSEFQKFF